MITGSADERKMLADISRATHSLERIAIALEAIAVTTPHDAATPPHDAAPTPLINPARREEMLRTVRKDMAGAVHSQIGSGFVPDYYRDLASEYVVVAEHLADEVARGDWA